MVLSGGAECSTESTHDEDCKVLAQSQRGRSRLQAGSAGVHDAQWYVQLELWRGDCAQT